jgi:hypothetical protein
VTVGGHYGININSSRVMVGGRSGIFVGPNSVSVGGRNGVDIHGNTVTIGGRSGLMVDSHTFSIGGRDGLVLSADGISLLGADLIGGNASGGVYLLRDPETGQVVRTGRTNDLSRRGAEHARDERLQDYDFEAVYRSDDYATQRGLEQVIHNRYQPPLNRIRPISPSNRNYDRYMNAANRFLEGRLCLSPTAKGLSFWCRSGTAAMRAA